MAYRARFEIHLQTGTTDPNAAMVHTCANGTRSVVPLTGGFQWPVPQDIESVFIYFITRRTPEVMLRILSEALRWNASDASKGYVLSVVDDKSEDEDPPQCV